jgi:predicted metalloprotease
MLVVLAVAYFTGVDVTPLLGGAQQPQRMQSHQVSAEGERAGQFTSAVLATTEHVWNKIFCG